jgi:hypothetical protein
MAEIKSAFEIAMERAEKIGSFSKEELEAQKWEEEGKKTAAAFLNGKIETLQEGLRQIPPVEAAEVSVLLFHHFS